ncbi:MAG: EVE domain-containing protein [Xenococcaceae cyanobacterium MO_167.B27]|nr:EVE domain-containing protein [Xenococcaceae cyanobacterium MO_167.B27]
MNYWLMKSEPKTYSIQDLAADKTTIWDGVRNYQARNFLRQMKSGDMAFFYHSNTKLPGIVGLMKIIETNVIDPTQFDRTSKYYDPKSTQDAPRWHTVTVEFVKEYSQPIYLSNLKQNYSGDELLLVKKGNRLSVMPIQLEIAKNILNLSENNRE